MLYLCLIVLNVFLKAASLQKPNFVFVLTDDQDLLLNGMLPMTNTIRSVANEGKFFANAFVNSPICCPSRSTILTGNYAHNTGVLNNSIVGNCSSESWQQNHEKHSISAFLKDDGYNTFYAGKYLNQYGMKAVGGVKHIPKGYDWWLGLKGNSRYYNYTLSINGSGNFFSDQYLTDVIANYSLDFLSQKHITENPFFMMLTPPACHEPFTPAKRHENYFPNATALRTPAFNFTPTHKHWLLQMPPKHLPNNVDILDNIQRRRLQSLLAVDEMIGNIVSKLKELQILNKTYIIFMSDNGFHIGQFTLPWDKRQPYQTDIRIPFLMSGPKIPKKSVEYYPISAVDIAPTILDLANVKVDDSVIFDGESFKKELFQVDEHDSILKYIFVEYFGESNSPKSVDPICKLQYDQNVSHCSVDQWCKCQDSKNNTYTCVIEFSDQHELKYCKFLDDIGFIEAYDCSRDKYELYNIRDRLPKEQKTKYETILAHFTKCAGKNCQYLI